MITGRVIFCLIVVVLFTCTSQPRYTSGSGSSKSNTNTGSARYTSGSSGSSSKSYSGIERFKGISSYYGTDFHGKLTANGEVFDQYGVTALSLNLKDSMKALEPEAKTASISNSPIRIIAKTPDLKLDCN